VLVESVLDTHARAERDLNCTPIPSTKIVVGMAQSLHGTATGVTHKVLELSLFVELVEFGLEVVGLVEELQELGMVLSTLNAGDTDLVVQCIFQSATSTVNVIRLVTLASG
jgi:hypothetical protein